MQIKNKSDKLSSAALLAPYGFLFVLFVVVPVVCAVILSFTYFNTIQRPEFVGIKNYISLFTSDTIFMRKVLPNTIVYAIFVGGGGYILSFFLAWTLAQMTKKVRTVMAIIIYTPSLTSGILIKTVWGVIFNGDKSGYLNYLLLKLELMDTL